MYRASVIRAALLLGLCLTSFVVASKTGFAQATNVVQERAVSFELDVQPILTAYGCNAGACHGKQRGQNGFQLSLLGFDPEYDYQALTRDARGRRLFPAAPAESLLLRKATAELPHGGGRKIQPGSEAYQLLLQWIAQGTRRRIENEPVLDRIALQREEFSLAPDQTDSLQLVAYYSDGTQRDVTRWAAYSSNESAVASVDAQGVITAGALPGETAVMARFMNEICVAQVVIPRPETLPSEPFEQLPRHNFIDDLVYAKLQKLSILPSPTVGDELFLRRATVDLIGRLPTPQEVRNFVDSSDPNKREICVNRLLEQPEYADHWANLWADLLRPNPYRVGIKAVLNYDNWIRSQFRRNVPYDEFVRQLVTAKGSTWQNGAATLYRDRRSPDEVATMVSQLFLGVRLECAKCHHHPFERWSQADFYQFAAHFAKVGRKGTGLSPPISGGEETVFTSTKGEVKHPLTGEVMTPAPLYGSSEAHEPTNETGDASDPRQMLAAWMTSPDNDYFAQVQVNRVWARLMGRGLVEPVDDLRSTNPPSNPELLEALAKDFAASSFDLKHLLKRIVLSRTYSHSSVPNETNASDRLNYSRHYRHRLRAEVLMDAIADVTQVQPSLDAMPPEARANQVWTHRIDSIFLDTFGRPNENQDPPCERTPDATVTQSLHLMNSKEIDRHIRSDQGRAATLATGEKPASAIVEELYLAIYSRSPREDEREYAVKLVSTAEERRTAIEDLMWAMINSPEFSIQN